MKKKPKDKHYNIGIDLGGTKIFAVLFDSSGKKICEERRPTNGQKGYKNGIKNLVETIETVIKKAKAQTTDVHCIGLGLPGIVNQKKGLLLPTANLGWPEIPIVDILQKKFQTSVSILNDVDAGTYGETLYGAGRGSTSVLGVFPGTGVGAGFVHDGKIFQGANFSAMEIGNMHIMTPSGEPARMEDLCSRLYIASQLAVETYRGRLPNNAKNYGTNIKNIKSRAIREAIEKDGAAALEVVTNAITTLGITIAGVVDLLNPDTLVLGGGLVEKIPTLYQKTIKKVISDYSIEAFAKNIKIKTAQLGDYATATGAIAYASEKKS